MRNRRLILIAWVLPVLLTLSCNQPFSPKAPFQEQPVVYSVLFTNRSAQIVRVYSNYDVPGFDPFENSTDRPIAGGIVTVKGPRGTYAFRDTLLPRTDTSRYTTPIPAYVSNWQPEPGQTYTLSVLSPEAGSTSATVTTLAKARKMYWYYPTNFMDYPDSIKYETAISAVADLPSQGNACFVQLSIEYSVVAGSGSRIEEREVPLWAYDATLKYATYPSLQTSTQWGIGMFYNQWGYRRAVAYISNAYRDTKLTFRRVIFRVLQLDQNWYTYYHTVRISQDPLSIRIDQPDFTNLSRGYGVFGACTVDSLIHNLPVDFAWNH